MKLVEFRSKVNGSAVSSFTFLSTSCSSIASFTSSEHQGAFFKSLASLSNSHSAIAFLASSDGRVRGRSASRTAIASLLAFSFGGRVRGGRSSIASLLASPFGRGHVWCVGCVETTPSLKKLWPSSIASLLAPSFGAILIRSSITSSSNGRVRGVRSASRSSSIASLLAPSFGRGHVWCVGCVETTPSLKKLCK